MVVLEEIDKFKKENSGRGKNAREVVRSLDALRGRGSLRDGVNLDNGGTLQILFTPAALPSDIALNLDILDNEILLTALALKQEGNEVQFISKDINARVKADALGLATQDYLKGYIPSDEFYKGWVVVQVPAVQLKKDIPDGLRDYAKNYEFTINQYALVQSQHNEFNARVYRYVGGKQEFVPVTEPQLHWALHARNPQQLMALDALFDESIQFVCLLGPAGTGKTFLALLAGLHQVIVKGMYQRMLISRPVVPLGPDIGYLPGDVHEKLQSWMQPIFDNLDVITHAAAVDEHLQELEATYEQQPRGGGRHERNEKKHKKDERRVRPFRSAQELVMQGKVSLEAITYMRGRSIPFQFILIDEVQNLSPHEVKTLVSRVGEGSKIVLCGDPYQIDSPYLDFSSNGLVVVSEAFKGQRLFSSVFLEKSERGELSKLVSELM